MKPKIAKSMQVLLLLLRPPKKQTVSEWAEENRLLGRESAFPGRWSNSLAPYLTEIMDSYNDPDVREIILIKPSQIGGTTALENIIGYIITNCPGPTMLVYPTDDAAKVISTDKIQVMAENTPAVKARWNEKKSKTLVQRFVGMSLYLTGTKSAQKLASKAIKNLFIDEIDKITHELPGEGDVVKLAEERVKTYTGRYKIIKLSTPTTKYGRIWKAMQSADVIKKPRVTCPHCAGEIELLFDHLKWEETPEGNDVTGAWYECQLCGGAIEERQRLAMIRTVRWHIVTQNRHRRERVAFWMNTLYSPFVTWERIALEWLDAQDDKKKQQNFTNSWLGEPWAEARNDVDAEVVLARQTETPAGTVPHWAELLTAGADVQHTCVYYSIRAWGQRMTSQNILHGRVDTLDGLEEVMNREYHYRDGTGVVVSLCGIDSGDQTEDVYDFCLENSDWALPVKGASHRMTSAQELKTINRDGSRANGQNLLMIDTARYKDFIMSRLGRESERPGVFLVHADVDDDYALQLTSEFKNTETGTWELKNSRQGNHYLDTEVYACAAADVMGVRSLHLREEE